MAGLDVIMHESAAAVDADSSHLIRVDVVVIVMAVVALIATPSFSHCPVGGDDGPKLSGA